jgi:molybdenum cofactor cytidylyltransferase
MRIGAVVLAAGRSARMPGNKLLLPLAGKPIVRHAVEAALASRASPVVAVTGNAAVEVAEAFRGLKVRTAENLVFSKGLSESLKCGIRNLPRDCDGAVILLGDMPFVRPALIDALIAAFEPGLICVPVRDGRYGNPVLWGRKFFPELLALEGDAGAKRLLSHYREVVHPVEALDDGPFIDIDTLEDLLHYDGL